MKLFLLFFENSHGNHQKTDDIRLIEMNSKRFKRGNEVIFHSIPGNIQFLRNFIIIHTIKPAHPEDLLLLWRKIYQSSLCEPLKILF